jgi:hypothetical protein
LVRKKSKIVSENNMTSPAFSLQGSWNKSNSIIKSWVERSGPCLYEKLSRLYERKESHGYQQQTPSGVAHGN